MKTAIASILVLASAVLAGPDLSVNTGRSIGNLITGNSLQLGKRQSSVKDSLTGNNTDPGIGYFEQPIDHNNPSLGTFKIRYLWSNEHWKGPGSPIVVFTPGQANISSYYAIFDKFNETLMYQNTAQLAYEVGAALVLVENRYYGESSPYQELTTANLQYLNQDQVMHDLVNFAKNAKLPFSPNSTASNVPWILTGGSYSGAVATYVADKLPGTYWAYYTSSAVVQSQDEFWKANLAFQKYGPKNCTKDVAAVVGHIDQVFSRGIESEKVAIKTMFGMKNLTHDYDFLQVLAGDPALWAGQKLYYRTEAENRDFNDIYKWCDAIEGAWDTVTQNYTNATLPGAEGVGMQKALKNWAGWWTNVLLPTYCLDRFGSYYPGLYEENSTYCLESVDPNDPFFTDLRVRNPWVRQSWWIQCNEAAYTWAGAPKGVPTVASSLLTVAEFTRICKKLFPTGPKGEKVGRRTQDQYNAHFGGWNIKGTKRLLHVNGEMDYWLPATFAAPQRPGGPLQSTPEVPTWVIPGGLHCTDFNMWDEGRYNKDVLRVTGEVRAQLRKWISEWPGYHGKIPSI
ncbi:Serine carboxypeptidase [Pyrenophora tritici-repentis]|nr:Serine carboxypeptidase [Pyrenophora tritici-repentis]